MCTTLRDRTGTANQSVIAVNNKAPPWQAGPHGNDPQALTIVLAALPGLLSLLARLVLAALLLLARLVLAALLLAWLALATLILLTALVRILLVRIRHVVLQLSAPHAKM
jgi:hypothetical protein